MAEVVPVPRMTVWPLIAACDAPKRAKYPYPPTVLPLMPMPVEAANIGCADRLETAGESVYVVGPDPLIVDVPSGMPGAKMR